VSSYLESPLCRAICAHISKDASKDGSVNKT
jgi:hypothetical protein